MFGSAPKASGVLLNSDFYYTPGAQLEAASRCDEMQSTQRTVQYPVIVLALGLQVVSGTGRRRK